MTEEITDWGCPDWCPGARSADELNKDLQDGSWNNKYAYILKLKKFDAGYRYLYTV